MSVTHFTSLWEVHGVEAESYTVTKQLPLHIYQKPKEKAKEVAL